MKNLRFRLAPICLFVFSRFAAAQVTDTLDPFRGHDETGKAVRVQPTPSLLKSHYGHEPSTSHAFNQTAVYGASFGSGNLINHGGPQISNAGFQAIYWNAAVANSSSTMAGYTKIMDQINAFLRAFADGQNWNNAATADYTIIQQYGAAAPISSSIRINPAYPAGKGGSAFVDTQTAASVIRDSQLQAYLGGLFRAGTLTPQSNTIYGVFFPSGTSVQLSASTASCTAFCAYHSGFYYNGQPIIYAAFPYPDCGGCNPWNFPAADLLTMFVGHETRESVTDAFGAWYDAAGEEADDKCAWSHLYRMANGGFLVQPEYSNGGTVTASGFTANYPGPGCVVPNAPCGPPPPPIGLTAAAGNAKVTLAWTAVQGASGYNIKRSGFSGTESKIASSAANSFTDSGLANGTKYFYEVSAMGTCGSTAVESANSSEASATPVAPVVPSFTLSSNPTSISISRSSSKANGNALITASSGGGFTGRIILSVSGLPAQSTAGFNLNSVSPGTSSSLGLSVGKTTPTGSYKLTITGTSSGVSPSPVVLLTLTVTN